MWASPAPIETRAGRPGEPGQGPGEHPSAPPAAKAKLRRPLPAPRPGLGPKALCVCYCLLCRTREGIRDKNYIFTMSHNS